MKDMPKATARGVLVDDQYLEVLELKRDRQGLKVNNYNWRKLPEGVVSRGRVVHSQVLADELKQLLLGGQSGAISGPVVLGLPQEQVFVKVFHMPQFEDKDLTEAISWHLSSLGPIVPKEAYTAHEVIGKSDDLGLTVLLMAAAKDTIDDYLETADRAGMTVAAVEPVALARIRLVEPKQLGGKTVALVNLAGGQLSVSILVNGKLWFSRETKLIEYNQIQISQLTEELVNFFSERKEINTAPIAEIVYAGDQSGLAALTSALTSLKLPLTPALPGWKLVGSKIIRNVERIGLAPVFGLALAGRLEERELVNLMPDWPRKKAQVQALSRLSRRIVLAAGLTMTLVGLIQGGAWWWLQQDSYRLNQQVLAEQSRLTSDGEVMTWAAGFNDTVTRIGLIEKKRTSQAEVLRQLATLIPAGVKLTAFTAEFNQESWSLSGVAETREAVLVFYDQLKQSQWFSRAKLYFSSLENNQGVVFRLSGGKT